ncbi:hypothetical protein DFH08DRAFT_1071886 [Mycena albidolilacea]|uniref:Uncharacterized protein n=1 Tax=Mycena albidolilacea TaxID=1033008 RepID=A0AAD7AR39_9AGAR|nr:hypothetical protein DFH08DRAFT_1071886 [Mycena albidolilacea]
MSILLSPASSDDVVVLPPADDPLHSDALRAYVTLSSSSSAVGAVGGSCSLRRTPIRFGITLAAVTIPLVFVLSNITAAASADLCVEFFQLLRDASLRVRVNTAKAFWALKTSVYGPLSSCYLSSRRCLRCRIRFVPSHIQAASLTVFLSYFFKDSLLPYVVR